VFIGLSHEEKIKSFWEKMTPQQLSYYLRIENAEGNVLIAVYLFIYLFIYLYACYSHNSKSIKPNRMKFGRMIGYYPGSI